VTPEGSTVVIFRQWKGQQGHSIIAIFPEEAYGYLKPGQCSSYETIGQHGGCDLRIMRKHTRPAPEGPELDALRQELKAIGYTLIEKKKVTSHMDMVRMGFFQEKGPLELLAEVADDHIGL